MEGQPLTDADVAGALKEAGLDASTQRGNPVIANLGQQSIYGDRNAARVMVLLPENEN